MKIYMCLFQDLPILILQGLMALILLLVPTASSADTPKPQQQVTGAELIRGDYNLTDHTGRAVTKHTFVGRYQLVFLGFTHCPNFCPLGLHALVKTLEALGLDSAKVIPIFITIDPDRDTPARLAEYLGHYDKRLVGLTGSQSQIDQAVQSFRGYYNKIKTKTDYTFDHSTIIYLIDTEGRFVEYFSTSTGAEFIADAIRKHFSK